MRRLPILFGAIVCLVALVAPSAAMAHTSLTASSETATPTPTPTTPTGPQKAPSSGGSTTAVDALTIVGFSIVTMAGLILVIRAGLKSANSEDED